MILKPVVNRITIYPIKTLGGVELQSAVISDGGCLLHDREFAIADLNGKFVNGKSNPLMNLLRTTYDLENELVSFRYEYETEWKQFHLQKEKSEIENYLTKFLGISVELLQNKTGRFMDIPDIGGATILSTASLETVSKWFDNMDLDETRKRFRATIEIEGVPAFWEDRLFAKEGSAIEFNIGDVTMFGIAPRERCVVPTRNPQTGEVIQGFQKTFAKHREENLPEWSNLKNYGHYYFLAIDCLIPATEIEKRICTGDEIKIIGEKILIQAE